MMENYFQEQKKNASISREQSGEWDEVFRIEVKVLQASTPSDIHISPLCFSSRAEQLEKELEDFYGTAEAKSCEKWEVDNKCAALSCKRKKWYRATISEILDNGKMRVLFRDIMETEDVPVSNIRALESRFFSFPVCVIKCHLSGIFPPETEWPALTCEFLQSQLDLYNHVYMTKTGELVNNSVPIQLWVKKCTQEKTLESTTEEWIVLNDVIVEQGLAIPKKAKLVQYVITDEENRSDEFDIWETSDVKDARSADVTKENESSFIPSVACDWLPPEDCRKDSFIGKPTHVDSEGVLYIHDEEDKPLLDQIRKSLLDYYKDSKPQAHGQYWTEGRLCIVRYHLDGGWYRGKILEVNEDCTYKVLFIDYGNTEICRMAELRNYLKHLEVPTLTKRCVLHGVSPVSHDGGWPIRVIDYIYSSVVDKCCEVTIIERAKDCFNPNKIKLVQLKDGFDMSEDLVSLGLAEFVSDSHPKEMERPLENDDLRAYVGKTYSQLDLPEDLKSFPIEVLFVKFSEFIVHVLNRESVPTEIKTIISDFVSLTDEIQTVAESLEKLENFNEGLPCISLYSFNGTWYRAEILRLDADRDLVLVRYVDYGNEEYVSKDKIRKCLAKWFKVCSMALTLKLHNVRMCKGVKKSDYLERLFECLSRPGLIAEIVQRRESFYEVEVKQNGVLAYQEMIDDGLMEVVKKSEIIWPAQDEEVEILKVA